MIKIRYKKIVLAIILIIFVLALLNLCSHHERVDSSNIVEIIYSTYLGEYESVRYADQQEIKALLNKLQCVNFYSQKEKMLHESPTISLTIKYVDGKKKNIDVAGISALITEISAENKINTESSKFYYVNPLWIKMLQR